MRPLKAIKTVGFMSFAAPLKKMKTGLASIAIRTRVRRRRGKKLGLAMHSRWGFSTLDRKVETHPSRANRAYSRPPRRERSAHVGAPPPLPRSPGCGGGGTQPKGLWPPAEPPTPCVPGVCGCALFFSALHLASERPGGGEACVRIRCWGPRRADARFCFRGSRAMPLWPAAVVCDTVPVGGIPIG